MKHAARKPEKWCPGHPHSAKKDRLAEGKDRGQKNSLRQKRPKPDQGKPKAPEVAEPEGTFHECSPGGGVSVLENMKQLTNPYLPFWEYIPDGEPYVFGDRVYVYGSHDFFGGDVYCMGDYMGWSAPVSDLGTWRCEGVIYRKDQDPENGDLQGNLYAPDVTVGPDGRYYLYYVLSSKGFVSVAVCDTPAGAYQFYGYVHYPDGTRLGERAGDEPQFDPGVLTENGKTYLYTMSLT